MKKYFFIIVFMICSFGFAQNCKYQISISSENLKQTGKFKLTITNDDVKPFKIRKEVNFCNMRLADLELYDESIETFEKLSLARKDIDCFMYKDRDFKLSPNKNYVYNVDIKSDFEVLQSSKFFETFKDRKYRFKISFSLDSYLRCGDSNTIMTDWIYKN